jgi:dTDP-4-amino-4,6-dideoxygalactose transaminase
VVNEVRVPLVDLEAQHREIAGELDAAWSRVLNSGRFIGGPEVERFEDAWAAYCGVNHAVGVANGTDALVVTLRALGITAGAEVILPTNTFIATAEAVALVGARPRFIDVDPHTLTMTADAVADAISPRTAAVIVVHLYGHVPNMDDILTVTSRAGLPLIEDAAQAHGAEWAGKRAGSFGVAGCFSFYPTKNLGAMGDGGAVVTNDSELAAVIRELIDHGRSQADRDAHVRIGTNSRLDALQSALLGVKLRHLDAWTDRRREIASEYSERLKVAGLDIVAPPSGSKSAFHLLVARVGERDRVRSRLAHEGIQTGIHYAVPCHQQHPYAWCADGPLPEAERASREIVSLPLFPQMNSEQVAEVADRLASAVRGAA